MPCGTLTSGLGTVRDGLVVDSLCLPLSHKPSSDKWLIQSGTPTANAAFNKPVMKHTPSDHPPVLLWYLVQTSVLLACDFGITARTITVVRRPHIESVRAMRLMSGMNRFPKHTMAQHVQLTIWNTTNTCQACHSTVGCLSKYIATASLPNIELMEEAESSHAQALRYPVKKPVLRPLVGLSTDDQ